MTKALLITKDHPQRKEAEDLIRGVYREKYGAVLAEFPPLIAALADDTGDIVCACGVRFATTGFFSTCYLDDALEDVVGRAFHTGFDENDMLEVTTLASRRAGHAIRLIRQVIGLGRRLGKSVGLFTTTVKVQALLRKAGMDLVQVGAADASRVSNPEQWGAYYEEGPAVFAVYDDPAQPIDLQEPGFGDFLLFPFSRPVLRVPVMEPAHA